MAKKYWFIAEEKETASIVSAFMLMPWEWEMEGIRLKVAQMAGAATLKECRRQGLVRELIKAFDQTLQEEQVDLAVINGIRGFYRQFGYCYVIPVENHINLPLELIPEQQTERVYTFRLAGEEDIAYLMQEDEAYRACFSISAFRDEAAWKFLLTERFHTIYGSEYWIMEHREKAEKFYCRVPGQSHFGGKGLLVSEISDRIHYKALSHLFMFCKQKAIEGQKPYIRLNLHDDSTAGKMAISMGAEKERQSAWQIKFPDTARLLTKIAPVLENRMKESAFREFCGTLKLDFFKTQLDLLWEDGTLASVKPGEGRSEHTFRIPADLFPILCLGHRTWQELAYINPDIGAASGEVALLIETLFPPRRSWLHEPA